jgi:hypothetical protein
MTVSIPRHRRVGRSVSVLVVAILAQLSMAIAEDRANPTPPAPGEPIVAIEVVRLDLFDRDKDGKLAWPYRAANALNAVTQEGFIRRTLLFRVGDPYDPALLEESGRILRATGFLNPVDVTAHPAEGGVKVVVTTRDQWSFEVAGSFDLFGSRSSSKLGFQDANFLGSGQRVGIAHSTEDARSTWAFTYGNSLLFGTRWQGVVEHQEASDGGSDELRLEHPFFALDTRYAAGTRWFDETQDDALYADGKRAVEGQRSSRHWSAWAGMRLSTRQSHIVRRLVAGFEHREDTFGPWRRVDSGEPVPTPEDRLLQGPMLRFTQQTRDYRTVHRFRSWTLQEDVNLGPRIEAEVGASLDSLGGDRDRFPLDVRLGDTTIKGSWLNLRKVWGSGRVEPGHGLQNGLVGVSWIATQLTDRGWQLRLLAEHAVEPDRDIQLTLGADQGLRGWEPDTFDGTGRAIANIQYRSLWKESIADLFAVGWVSFIDVGATWNPTVGRSTEGLRADIGVGLLIDITKFSAAETFRIEVAQPSDGSGVVVSIATRSLF